MKRIPAYIMTALVVLTVVKCAHESKYRSDPAFDVLANPYGMMIDSCKYIVTPDYRNGGWQIGHTIHAGDCPNEIHGRKRP